MISGYAFLTGCGPIISRHSALHSMLPNLQHQRCVFRSLVSGVGIRLSSRMVGRWTDADDCAESAAGLTDRMHRSARGDATGQAQYGAGS
jgi:hypothetical protein